MRVRELRVYVLAVAVASIGTAATATTWSVPGDAATLAAAADSTTAGDTIQVAAGTFSPSMTGDTFPVEITEDNITLLGQGIGVTTLDAESTGGILVLNADKGGRVSGFTITGGLTDRGTGIWIMKGDPEVDHNLIADNYATLRAAGLFSFPTGSPWIHHNVFWKNLDADTTDDIDPHAAVIQGDGVGAVFEHNVVGRTDGNGLLTSGTVNPSVRHNIFYENGKPPPEGRGRGICWFSSAAPEVFHNVFHANQIAAILWPAGGGNFSGAAANDFDTLDTIYGNIDGEPLFTDPDNIDVTVQWGSPAIDGGDPSFPYDPDGTIADIGAYYYDQSATGTPWPDRAAPSAILATPNPFRHGTDIRLSLEESVSADVEVEVFDVSGRRVRSLYSGALSGGSGVVHWNGRNEAGSTVASGVYYLRVRTDDAIRTRPLILLR